MGKFAYNNEKNANIGYKTFKLNCGYYLSVLYKQKINSRFKSKLVEKLSAKLKVLMIICQKNFYYAQKLQKWAHN